MKFIIALFSLFLMIEARGKDPILGIGYLNKTLALVHESASTNSASLTSIMCGFPLKILKKENLRPGWLFVHAGEAKGYIQESFLSDQPAICFQEKYPKFFQTLNFNLTDFYYWGKLEDQYEYFETKGR